MNWSLDLSEKWKIPSYMAKTEIQAEDALNVAGFFLAGQAKRLTPTITARLKNSISSAVKGKKRVGLNDATPGMPSKKGAPKPEEKARESEGVPTPSERLVAWIGTSVVYAAMIEFGDSGKRKQQSYLRRAFRENKKQLMKFLAGRMKK